MNGCAGRVTPWAWRTLWAIALGLGVWLAANAHYRADDFGLVREAWADGDLGAAIAHWWRFHVEPRDPGAWPKFYRPVWHATFLLDAHLFGAVAAASAALSWALHVANVALVALLARRLLGGAIWPLVAAFLCLLPGAAMQAPTWIAARGQVLATTGTLAAIAFATAPRLRTWPRAIGTTVAVLLAAGAHDFGATAGPLAAFAAWLQHRTAVLRPGWPSTIVLPTAVAVAWTVWRASRLGTWLGGYESSESVLPFRLLDTLVTGTGAIVLPGDGTLPPGLVAWIGAFALLALVATSCAPHRGRAAARLAGAMLVLALAPAIGSTFRGDELANGRYLYTAHCAFSLGLPAMLVALQAGRLRHVAHGIATLAVFAAAVGFVGVAPGLHRALGTTRAVFAALDALPPSPTVLLDLPDADGQHLIGRNALPAALGAPFRSPQPHVLGWATDSDLRHGFVLGLATSYDQTPDATPWYWNGRTHTFSRTDTVAPPSAAAPTPHLRPRLEPPEARDDTTWTFRGEPGDAVVLLAGDRSCRLDLGAAGQLGVAGSLRLPIGVADATGVLRFTLPTDATAARRLQAAALRGFGPSVFFADVHVHADDRRR